MRTLYSERDYVFGQAMLNLRTEIGLTQAGLANQLCISRRAVGEWEAGSSYPKVEHLKEVIALGVRSQAFPQGSEAEKIRALWKAARQRVFLDESWLSSLLEHVRSPHLHLMPKPGEESTQGRMTEPLPTPGPRVYWDGALTVPVLYGREEELACLSQWIVQGRASVVSVLGMGGIGKSALSVSLMRQLAVGIAACPCPFEVVIFRSLRDAPSCEALIAECLQVLSPQSLGQSYRDLSEPAERESYTVPIQRRISLLLEHLRKTRTLLVLDNLECLLAEGDVRGHFRPDFLGYGQLLRRVAETVHRSCLLLTSREKPADLRLLECKYSSVHSLRLVGLDAAACKQLLAEKKLVGIEAELASLAEVYGGNPLALKVVTAIIVDLFGGAVSEFLAGGPLIFGGITDLLDEQFARLSALEKTVFCWLAIVREPVTLDELLTMQVIHLSRVRVLEAVDAGHRRSLIEPGQRPGSFTLQPVMLEYVTTVLIAEVASEIKQGLLDKLIKYDLALAGEEEYMRQIQVRLLLSPLLMVLQSVYRGRDELEERLLGLLEQLCQQADSTQGYGPANLSALLRLLRGHPEGLDL